VTLRIQCWHRGCLSALCNPPMRDSEAVCRQGLTQRVGRAALGGVCAAGPKAARVVPQRRRRRPRRRRRQRWRRRVVPRAQPQPRPRPRPRPRPGPPAQPQPRAPAQPQPHAHAPLALALALAQPLAATPRVRCTAADAMSVWPPNVVMNATGGLWDSVCACQLFGVSQQCSGLAQMRKDATGGGRRNRRARCLVDVEQGSTYVPEQ